jgi:hypothetical protein
MSSQWEGIAWRRVVARLPGTEAARLLWAHLAARFSPDGRLESVLAGDTAILLPSWLAERELTDSERIKVTTALLLGFSATEAHTLTGMVLPGEQKTLVTKLWAEAKAELAGVDGLSVDPLPDDAGLDPIEAQIRMAVGIGASLGDHDREHCSALATGLATALILERDVRDLVPSLRAHRLNRAGSLLIEQAGLSDDGRLFPTLLGMVGLGHHRSAVLSPWRKAMTEARGAADSIGSRALLDYIDCLADRLAAFEQVEESFVVIAASLEPLPIFGRREVSHQDPIDQAVAMARGFLMADPDLGEAWEVHRRGMLGRDLVSAPFAAGMILEVLARHGEPVADRIERYLGRLAAQDYTYYDAPEFRWMETDTVGIVLRLLTYAENGHAHRLRMSPAVETATEMMQRTGTVPVWLVNDLVEIADAGVLLLGEGCGAIQARMLTALHRDGKDADMLEPALSALLSSFIERGLSIGVNYPPLFVAVAIRELLGELATRNPPVAGEEVAAALRTALLQWNERSLSPLEAALFLAATVNTADADLAQRRIVDTILSSQDFDGGWPAEPVFFAPNKGGLPSWHRSRLLTTAFCYDSLRRWQATNTSERDRRDPA